VHLGKAEQSTVRLSSFLGKDDLGNDDLDLLGVWRWVLEQRKAEGLPPPDARDLEPATVGAIWMLTPFSKINLVHAVQQPLLAPQLTALSTVRDLRASFAYFGATVPIHGRSTARLDVQAGWEECVDDPLDPAHLPPGKRSVTAHVFDFTIHLPDEGGEVIPRLLLSPSSGPGGVSVTANASGFTAGERVLVTFQITIDNNIQVDAQTANARGNFSSTFAVPPNVQIDQCQVAATGQISGAMASATFKMSNVVSIAMYNAASDVVTFLAPPVANEPIVTFLSRHEFGDTKHRRVSYKCIATTRFREYFPPEITTVLTQITQSGAESEKIDIPSSARPAAPLVLYAIPVFDWSRTSASDGSQVRFRKGGGVRVYLERPWFSSGDGELLAVILVDEAHYPPGDDYRLFVTQWGNDPAWYFDQTPRTSTPVVANFSRAVVFDTGLRLDEIDPSVIAVGHSVDFDCDRGLWFCDIQIDAGQAYAPLARLALARYQPHSLPGVELSRVVLADFVPLLPDRTVTVNPVQGDSNSFTITVEGLTYPGDNLIEVTLEQRIPGTQDEAGWEPVSPVSGGASGAALWNGKVTLPIPRVAGQFRVVIREQEQYPVSRENIAPDRRPIFAEAIEF
jgi:hypothetical protein